MEQAPKKNPLEELADTELDERIRKVNKRIIAITDSPTLGMADMDIGRSPEDNATDTAVEQGQFIPNEEDSVDHLRMQMRQLELERDRRRKIAA